MPPKKEVLFLFVDLTGAFHRRDVPGSADRLTTCLFSQKKEEKKKEKEKDEEEEGGGAADATAQLEEMNAKLQQAEQDKMKEAELRNFMQLERVRPQKGCAHIAAHARPVDWSVQAAGSRYYLHSPLVYGLRTRILPLGLLRRGSGPTKPLAKLIYLRAMDAY